jgi:serine/threonine protein kinase
MLQTLSQFPHPHITPHLASWTQKETFYMLFPLAELNLSQFLRRMPNPELNNEFVNWLFTQLKGLADGVRLIHNLGPSGLGPESLVSPKKPGRTGFHHDIKPQNILVFAKTDSIKASPKMTDYVLKLSDFGAARINVILSQSGGNRITSYKLSDLTYGDSVYGAPDFALESRTSRPYDLWSLGCVFLEVLIWTFGLSNSNLDDFEKERLNSRGAPMSQDSAFWHRDKDGKVRLKAAVVQRLKQLQKHCQNRGVFKHLVSSTARLLTKMPSQRSKAQDICTELDAARLQLQVDLGKPGFYVHDIKEYRPVAAPPTRVSNENSRRPSIDEHSIYAPEDGFLRVGTEAQRRSTQPTSRRGSGVRRQERSTSEPVLARAELSPVITQDLPTGPSHSQSPSISISHADDPFTPVITDDDNQELFPLYGSHQYQPGLEDFVPRGGAQSSDSRSQSLP